VGAILRAAAESLTRVLLELGGTAPVIVFDDADVDGVAEGVKVAGYDTAGQDRTAARRVLAGARMHDEGVDEQSGPGSDMSIDAVEHDTEIDHVMVNIQ
jgi:aminobutyraldehyde dehydrogenase